MSIGKWIVVVFILFGGFIGTLVTVCMREDISLVSKDYYKQELAYQERIGRINNTKELMRKPVISITQEQINITFDSTHRVNAGTVELFCPSDSKMDRSFSLTANQTQSFIYPLSGLKSGMYRVKMLWSMDGKDYFQEEIVNL